MTTAAAAAVAEYGPQLPTLDDLVSATAATTEAIARHEFGRPDISPAAEMEAATLTAYLQRPEAEAVLEIEP
jgi:hypothetical protein